MHAGGLHVAAQSPQAQSVLNETASKVEQVELASAHRIAARTAGELNDHGLHAAASVETGRPTQAILQRAGELEADLIVIGAHGLSAQDGFRLGTTAHQLADYADQSVLVVRPPLQPQPFSVVLTADGSPEAYQAAAFLCHLDLPNWAEVTIVSVAEAEVALPTGESDAVSELPVAIRQAMLDAAEANALEAVVCLSGCAADIQHSVRVGRPAAEILAAAHEHDADLIVLGAHCPTLTVRGQAAD